MEDKHVWDLYFVGIVGWQLHPKNVKEDERTLEQMLEDSMYIVDLMLKKRNERWRG
jgi:hypothetical protein